MYTLVNCYVSSFSILQYTSRKEADDYFNISVSNPRDRQISVAMYGPNLELGTQELLAFASKQGSIMLTEMKPK